MKSFLSTRGDIRSQRERLLVVFPLDGQMEDVEPNEDLDDLCHENRTGRVPNFLEEMESGDEAARHCR